MLALRPRPFSFPTSCQLTFMCHLCTLVFPTLQVGMLMGRDTCLSHVAPIPQPGHLSVLPPPTVVSHIYL